MKPEFRQEDCRCDAPDLEPPGSPRGQPSAGEGGEGDGTDAAVDAFIALASAEEEHEHEQGDGDPDPLPAGELVKLKEAKDWTPFPSR